MSTWYVINIRVYNLFAAPRRRTLNYKQMTDLTIKFYTRPSLQLSYKRVITMVITTHIY